jgi:hypothetical protein
MISFCFSVRRRLAFFAYLGHYWILAHMAFSLFTDVSSDDVTDMRSRLDRYSFLNRCFHHAYK